MFKRIAVFVMVLVFSICSASSYGLAATMGEKNALASAHNYLMVLPFSYEGLINQLEYEGYTHAESKYAADNCGADWYTQAARSAQNYLAVMPFSKKGLIDQLKYDGFTSQQAEYGASVAYGDNATKPYTYSKPSPTKPTVTVKPTPKPTPNIDWQSSSVIKPAGEAIVYHWENGKSYHLHPSCWNIHDTPSDTLANSIAGGYRQCVICYPPETDILEKENVVWCDEVQVFHVSDECSEFQGQWSLKPLADAMSEGYQSCYMGWPDGYLGIGKGTGDTTISKP